MKKLTLSLLLSLASISSMAASGPFDGTWYLTFDKTLDNLVVSRQSYDLSLNSHHNVFTGEYASINNDSIFEGKTFSHPSRSTTLISFVHYDNTYYRIFSGKKVGNVYIGTWYDNAGQKGDFRLNQ